MASVPSSNGGSPGPRGSRRVPAASIRARLTLSHLAVIVVAMGLSGLLLLSSLDRYFSQAMQDNLLAQAQITAQALIPGAAAIGPATDPRTSVSNTLRQQRVDNIYLETQNVSPPLGELDLGYLSDASLGLSAQLDTRIRVLDVRGTVQFDSAGVDQGADLQQDPLADKALSGTYATGTDEVEGVSTMHVAVPVTVDGRLVGAVYLSQPRQDVQAVLRDVRLRWLLSMAIALLLSGTVGLALSGAIARPVRRLTAAAGEVARGHLDQHVPVRSRDELGQLSAAFNEMTARLRTARQMQTDFVANVSHELRTPLTSVKGLVETLSDGAVDDREARDRFLATIEGETDRLIRLVNDLLLLSRVDSDALTLRREAVDIVRLAEAAMDPYAVLASERDLDLRLDAADDLPLAWADPDRVTQVLLNLLDNAVKYSHTGGAVTVAVSRGEGPTVQVQVRDEGVGIPADSLPRVGERFYRVEAARTRAQGGSGLGLAIARALVRAHGGELWLDSVEGEGTTASLTLPAATPGASTTPH